MDELKFLVNGPNGTWYWCSPSLHVVFVDSEFYDDVLSAIKYDTETPLVHSTPVTMVWLLFYCTIS